MALVPPQREGELEEGGGKGKVCVCVCVGGGGEEHGQSADF